MKTSLGKSAKALKVVKTSADHKRALAAIEELWNVDPGTPEHDLLEVLSLLVEDYERRTFPLADPDPVAAIEFRLEQLGLSRKDLEPLLGSRARVSEILTRKRGLSVAMIRRLHDALHIPYEALIPHEA